MTRLFLRVIEKSKEAYALKVLTLGTAFACCLLILTFSFTEFSFDHFHENYPSIFRILQRNNDDAYSGNRLSTRVPLPVYEKLQGASKDSIILSRVKLLTQCNLITGSQTFRNTTFHAVDSAIGSIFTFEILNGSLDDFSNGENVALLSVSAAEKYFGSRHAAGRKFSVCTFSDTVVYRVAAVFDDYPINSHESFNVFLKFSEASLKSLNFNPGEFGVYGRCLESHVSNYQMAFDKLNANVSYRLQPISEIYFGPRVLGEEARHGDHYSVIILIGICSLILFLAVSGFVNLTTLTLPNRAKELAIKKLAGSSNWRVMLSFAKESFGVVGISLVFSVLLITVASRWLDTTGALNFSDLARSNSFFNSLIIVFGLVTLTAISPLFIIWKFAHATPNRLLSTDTITFPQFKRTVSVLQLGISIFLMIASLVVRRQISYSLIKEPGRNHDQVVYVSYPASLTNQGLNELRKEWKKSHPNILDITATSQIPDHINSRDPKSGYYFMTVDPGYQDFFHVNMTKGKWFGANNDDSSFVVNEFSGMPLDSYRSAIGIFQNLDDQYNQPSRPLMLKVSDKPRYNILCIRVLEVDIRRTVSYLSNYFEEGGLKAHVNFLNKPFETWLLYQDRLNTLSGVLAVISAVLACLAIYGLAISLVRDKLKQIAIHKLWGAEFRHLIHLLIKEFAGQMLVAIIIFLPLTYIALKEALRTFVYSTPFSWLDPLVPLLYCALIIGVLCSLKTLSLNQNDLSAKLK